MPKVARPTVTRERNRPNTPDRKWQRLARMVSASRRLNGRYGKSREVEAELCTLVAVIGPILLVAAAQDREFPWDVAVGEYAKWRERHGGHGLVFAGGKP